MQLQMYIQEEEEEEEEECGEMGQKPEGGARRCSDEHRPNKTSIHNAETSFYRLRPCECDRQRTDQESEFGGLFL